MNGMEVYDYYQKIGEDEPPGSDARRCLQTIETALYGKPGHTLGREYVFDMVEEAERTGQRIKLIYPIPWDEGPSEPHAILLSSIERARDYSTTFDQTGNEKWAGRVVPPTR